MPSLILTSTPPTNSKTIRLKRGKGLVLHVVADPGVLVAVQDTTSDDSPIIRLDDQQVNSGNTTLASIRPTVVAVPAAFEYLTVTWKGLPNTPATDQSVWWDIKEACCGIR